MDILASVGDIYRALDKKAPFAYQMDFDNAGFLVGREEAEASRVLVALDLTDAVLEEAIEKQVDLIVTHHPVIWGKFASVTDRDLTGRRLIILIEHGISAICAHTNLDAIEGGVNSELARLLGLLDPLPLEQDGIDVEGQPYGIGRVGLRAAGATSVELFALEVKAGLGLTGLRLMDAGRPVYRVAVGGGACGGMLAAVLRHDCDTFVTSELKHDVYLEAKACGINLIDAGHGTTERIICPVLVDWLSEAFPSITVLLSECQGEAFSYR